MVHMSDTDSDDVVFETLPPDSGPILIGSGKVGSPIASLTVQIADI